MVGVLGPPRDEWAVEPNSRGDGRGGLERAPWEEPLSEMVLARRRGVGAPLPAAFAASRRRVYQRLQHAHDEMSAAHRGLAWLAADCMPAGDDIGRGDLEDASRSCRRRYASRAADGMVIDSTGG